MGAERSAALGRRAQRAANGHSYACPRPARRPAMVERVAVAHLALHDVVILMASVAGGRGERRGTGRIAPGTASERHRDGMPGQDDRERACRPSLTTWRVVSYGLVQRPVCTAMAQREWQGCRVQCTEYRILSLYSCGVVGRKPCPRERSRGPKRPVLRFPICVSSS